MSGQAQRQVPGESVNSRTGVEQLLENDSVFRATFIFPDAAQRMVEVGIERLDDFLAVSAVELAERMGIHGVTAQILTRWQSQVSLMLNIKGLGQQPAMLLVAAGFPTAESIAHSQRSAVHRAVREVVADQASQERQYSELDAGVYPQSSEINTWIALASAHVECSQRRCA